MIPLTRADCIEGERPCPWVRCRYHLEGNTPDTCVLDVTDRGVELSLREAGEAMGISGEMARLIERAALEKLQAIVEREDCGL